MRPITLEIAGLHSFRQKQVINFDRLLDDGLFGIFGPTGSGKSTILDAITLALYGNVRRASHGIRGVINEQEKNAAVSFTFEIGNGAERQRYTAERHLVRKKEGAEVRGVRLIHHTSNGDLVLARKKTEMEEEIQKIIGITLQDFQHAVMLPQGDFASFLALKPADRGKALQRLFGLQQYGEQLEAKVKRLEQELKMESSTTSGSLRELAQYDDQALKAYEANAAAANDARITAETALRQATNDANAARILLNLIEELSKLEQAIAKIPDQEEVLRSYYAKQKRAQQAEATRQAIADATAARNSYNQAESEYKSAIDRLSHHEPTLKNARDRFAQAEKAFEDHAKREVVVEKLQSLRQDKETLQEKIKELRWRHTLLATETEKHQQTKGLWEAVASNLREKETQQEQAKLKLQTLEIDASEKERMRVVADLLRNCNDAATQFEKQRAELKKIEQQQGELHQEERKVKEEVDALRTNLENIKQQLEQTRNHEAQLVNRLEELRTVHSELTTARGVINAYDLGQLRKQLEKGETTLSTLHKEKEEHDPRITEAETNYQIACRRRKELEQRLGLATVVAHLHDGQPCPLCGSIEHPAPYHPQADEQEQANKLRKDEEESEALLKATQAIGQQMEQRIATANAELIRTQQTFAEAESKITDRLQALNSKLSEYSQLMVIASVDELEEAIAQIEHQGKVAKQEKGRIENELNQSEQQISSAEKQWSKRANNLAKIEGEVAAIDKVCQQQRSLVSNHQAFLTEAEQKLAHHIGDTSVEKVQAELDAIGNREREIDEVRRFCTEIEEGVKNLREEEKKRREEEQNSKNHLTAAETAHNQLETEVKNLKESITQRLNELVPTRTTGETVEMILEAQKTELERIDKEHADAKLAYESAQTEQRLLTRSADEAYNKLCSMESHRDTANLDCHAVIANQGFSNEKEATAALLTPDEVLQLTQNITELEQQINQLQKREAELREQVGGTTITPEEVAAVEQAKQTAEVTLNNAISKQGAAQGALEQCREQNKKWNELQAEQSKADEQIEIVQKLGKYLRANSFVNYLANERLDDVCRRATQLLEGPTNHRLEIYSDKKDGFYIVDNSNGGIHREAGSLSGGETFLVSLALALALSDTIQLGHAPLEFFFLDEGFGTLDNELLDTVMDELERLRSSNRAIGLISHVRELRDRIPRKLIVTPATIEHGTMVKYER